MSGSVAISEISPLILSSHHVLGNSRDFLLPDAGQLDICNGARLDGPALIARESAGKIEVCALTLLAGRCCAGLLNVLVALAIQHLRLPHFCLVLFGTTACDGALDAQCFKTTRFAVSEIVELRGVLRALLARLPKVSIDHGLTAEGFDDLLWLVERGIKVKATGFGRCDFDVAEALRRIDAVNPEALMFGTDLPCTRAPRVFEESDIEAMNCATGARGVFRRNAIRLFANT